MATPASVKRSDTILVQELLAFVQNKLDVMDELSLEQICATSYTDAEITAARQFLADTAAVTAVRLASRRADGSGKRNIQDIFRAFKETDPDDIPTYVARDLNKLPPVTFDHVDVTSLLKDIQLLKSSVEDIKAKLVASERASAELQREVTSLRNADVALAQVSPPRKRQKRPPLDTSQRSKITVTTDPVNRPVIDCDPPTTQRICDGTSSLRPSAPVWKPDEPSTSVAHKGSFAPVLKSGSQPRSRRRCPNPPPPAATTRRREGKENRAAPVRAAPKTVGDDDGFTLVGKKPKRRANNRNKRGTVPAASCPLKAATPVLDIYISRVAPQMTHNDILRHIEQTSLGPITVLNISRLEPSRPTNFKSYWLQVPAVHEKILLGENFWPEGIVFRRFRAAHQKSKPLPTKL